MCTLMVLHRCHPEFWLVAAANRDERLDRPSAPPGVLRENPRAVGGRDLVAGGTWLGLSAGGVFVAVTNRRGGAPDPARRSRGLLALDALGLPAVPAVVQHTLGAGPQHNPFNLLVLTREAGAAVSWDGEGTRSTEVRSGPLVITTGEPNDARIPNVARGLALLEGLAAAPAPVLVQGLARACGDHGQEDPEYPPFCLHCPPHGTVSSTVLLLRTDGTGCYLFAPGPPCTTPYQDLSHLLPV